MANIEQLAIERQFIDEVCAVAFPSPDSYGKRMTKVFGMKKVAKYGKEGEDYTLRLLPANAQSKFWNVPGTRGEDRLFKLYSAVG